MSFVRALTTAAALTALASTSSAALTLLTGPSVGTHVGNLVSGGSFEAGPPGAVAFWATGTTLTPQITPPGWTGTGGPINYARWGNDGTTPPSIAGSAPIPDGVKALYFGNAQGGMVNLAPIFNPDGEVTFAGPALVGTTVGAPVVLSQTVPTDLSPAPSYLLSFWVSGEHASTGGSYDGIFGLRVTNTQVGDPIRYFVVPAGGALGGYGDQKRFEFSFTPLNPAAPVTLEFINWGHFNLAPYGLGGTTELVLDDVIINAVPTPGALALVGLALPWRRPRR